MPAPPAVNRRIIEALLEVKLPDAGGRRLLLVHGRYADPAATEFSKLIAGTPRRIRVTDQQSVLGMVEAWREHQTSAGRDDVLVVTTGVDDAQLGWDLRAYAVGRATQTVNRTELVIQRFGAKDVDQRIRREPWLVDALLEAEPSGGWRRAGSVLTRDAAVRALLGARLGGEELAEGTLDIGALLAWSCTAGPARFAELPEAEQTGLTEWLAETVGDAARVVMELAAAGRAHDTVALGLVSTVATQPGASAESAMAFGGLLGTARPRPAELRVFTDAVEGMLERWITDAEPGGSNGETARRRVLEVVSRADELATRAGLTLALAENRFLPSGFSARLRSVAGALSPAPDGVAVSRAEKALADLLDHGMARLHPNRIQAAAMSVRLMRWLAAPPATVDSVAAGISGHVGEWGWVDQALTVLWAGDGTGEPMVGNAYRAIYEAARARRDRLDETFAHLLEVWTHHAATQAAGGCLLVEDVLTRIALPLAAQRPPLVVLLDGMSSAVAAELGAQLAGRPWTEVSPSALRRVAAVAAIPSVTLVSRASLLTGGVTEGDQATEKNGFTAFWSRHQRKGRLFHKGEIAGLAGHRLAEDLVADLAGDGVVGVVLNTIDDALSHGREGDRTSWRVGDLTYLPELLDAARGYKRPVVLVGDHGHVLERSPAGNGPVADTGAESPRWRTGTPEAGEIELSGPRVVYGNGHVVAPWREDIRYTQRRAGYHGGASLAEMTVPMLILLPSADLLPTGWSVLPPESVTPSWWVQRRAEPVTAIPPLPAPSRKSRRSKTAPQPDTDALFALATAEPVGSPETLGTLVVETDTYKAQRAFVRKPPDKQHVAAVIDALIAADETLSLAAVAAKAGRAGRNPEFFATTLQRLLNVEGYPVLSIVDSGSTVRLNTGKLREQFELESP